VEKIAISKFKAECLAILERVRRTGKAVQVTRFGKPVAEVVPPSPPARTEDWIGSMQGTGRIVGDIIEPVCDSQEWERLRE
jgi:prevent-host-death family protein